MTASSLLSYITSTTLGDGKWKGTTHTFILHWQEQVRKYHDLHPQNVLSPDLLCTLLQNAVHPIDELRQVKLQAAQFKTHTGKDLLYDEYCSLLVSAAQQHDLRSSGKHDNVAKRQIYEHDVTYNHGSDNLTTSDYDIDQPLDILQAHATHYGQGPRLAYDQWHALPDDAKKIWDTLSQEAKAIILRPPPKPDPNPKPSTFQRRSNAPPPRWPPFPCQNINEHDIDYLVNCLHELHGGDIPPPFCKHNGDESTSVHEDTNSHVAAPEPEQPLLAHMTKKKPLPPGNVKRLLSPTANKPSTQLQEVNVNGIVYRQVNVTSTIYNISSCHAAGNKSSLVDRGANGGIAGDDVRIIDKTSKTVDIQGIDNLRINAIPIVTAGGVINTQKGPVIAIMHHI